MIDHHLEPDTSKAALIFLVMNSESLGYRLVDGQVESEHLIRMGARLISREEFLRNFVKNPG
jgi:leucyl/phenylalanyl-tRNA--protein transferase